MKTIRNASHDAYSAFTPPVNTPGNFSDLYSAIDYLIISSALAV